MNWERKEILFYFFSSNGVRCRKKTYVIVLGVAIDILINMDPNFEISVVVKVVDKSGNPAYCEGEAEEESCPEHKPGLADFIDLYRGEDEGWISEGEKKEINKIFEILN